MKGLEVQGFRTKVISSMSKLPSLFSGVIRSGLRDCHGPVESAPMPRVAAATELSAVDVGSEGNTSLSGRGRGEGGILWGDPTADG
jgi:hypothetical protein